jgi:gas vesicle protein
MRKSKTTPSPAPRPPENDGGNFGAGFFIGIVSGAVGMFLFGTKQGHEVLSAFRQQLEKQVETLSEPETQQKLIAAAKTVKKATKQTAKDWQEKFPKFQGKNLSS